MMFDREESERTARRGLERAALVIPLASVLWLVVGCNGVENHRGSGMRSGAAAVGLPLALTSTGNQESRPAGQSEAEQEAADDLFVPTEEVSADRSVSFPTDI